jgi:NAD+ diphosphatase
LTFRLDGAPSLSRFTVDRRDPLRDDADRQAQLWPSSLVVLVDQWGRFPGGPDGLALVRGAEVSPEIPPGAVLLGEHEGIGYWAVPADDNQEWTDLRRSGADLDATSAGLAVTAVAVLGWHAHSPFCPRCGSRTAATRAGWARRCSDCGLEEYPRTDPAVICLVHDGADHVLLGRGPQWPKGRFSVLAGFVEAGESLEACVVREVAEEVGVTVRDVEYLGSQPWPFPRSLMIGFQALADRDQPLHLADGEIAEARWVHRDDVRKSLDTGSWAGRDGIVHSGHSSEPDLLLPGPVSIAGAMLRSWAAVNRG